MTKYTLRLLILIFSSLILISIIGCEADNPASVYDPVDKGFPTPSITSIMPADSILAGLGEITIVGKNFSPRPEENLVFFNKDQIDVIAATETELKLKSPNKPADKVIVKISRQGAYHYSNEVTYKLLRVFWEWGDFDDYDDPYGLTMDKDENLYVSLVGKEVVKVPAEGGEAQLYSNTLVDKTSNMRMGPDGFIYYVNILKYVFRIPPGGGTNELFATLPGGAFDLDFDQNGNLYCGGNGYNLYRVNSDGTNDIVAEYPNVYIRSVRVFNDYVYVAGKYSGTDASQVQEGVWRNQILSPAGEVGPNELVFDWGSQFKEQDYRLLSINFSADGMLYLGTDGREAIFTFDANGKIEPLYPGVIEPESYTMCWGNSSYLYITRRNDDAAKKRVIKLNMLKDGAPYYGRN